MKHYSGLSLTVRLLEAYTSTSWSGQNIGMRQSDDEGFTDAVKVGEKCSLQSTEQPNNGMHPTRFSVPLMLDLSLITVVRAGDAGCYVSASS